MKCERGGVLVLVCAALLLPAMVSAQLPPGAEVMPRRDSSWWASGTSAVPSRFIEGTKPNENFPKPHMDQGIKLEITWMNNPAADQILQMLDTAQPEDPERAVSGFGDAGRAVRQEILSRRHPGPVPQGHHPLDRRGEGTRSGDLADRVDGEGAEKRPRGRQHQQLLRGAKERPWAGSTRSSPRSRPRSSIAVSTRRRIARALRDQ